MEGNPVLDDNLIQGDGSFQVHEGLNPQFYQFQDVMKEIEKSCDDNWNNFDEEGGGGCDGCCKGKGEFLWRRVKWTVQMVKLLINAVCYIDEDASFDCQGGIKRKLSMSHKIGKWRCVSKLMVERGYHVSPQQCEDKFNDLNRRYKRLNDVLGKGTSCKVVEKPEHLDVMDVSDKSRKYNGDNEFEKELHDAEPDDVFHKGNDVSLNGMEYGKSSAYGLQEQWMAFRLLELQKQKLQIQVQKLELEKKRFKWRRTNWNQDKDVGTLAAATKQICKTEARRIEA
ncbi:hypothetical protein Goari_021740 [Gossypium aridum]|uniref:Myb/SANT-like DNA-binding domain-containing protein n=1 Tax=Gossypium aridum TaxID=34290 RepID=A0A7J8YF72_GOSAI|nr:hypothetical protein [Gossypium aridum]